MPVPATRPTHRRRRTSLAALAAIGMGSALLVGAHQASAAPTGPDPQRAAAYLTAPAQLVDGHYYDPFGLGQADWGLTIDGALGPRRTGGEGRRIRRSSSTSSPPTARTHAGTDVISWTGIGTEFVDGGSIGKLALLAEVAGRDPHRFAGHDLVAELAKATCTSTTPIGQSPCAGAGSYAGSSSVFKQALGLIGQVRGGAGEAAVAPAGRVPARPAGRRRRLAEPHPVGRSRLRRRQHRHRGHGPHPRARGRRGGRDGSAGSPGWRGTQLADGAFPGFAPSGSEPAHSTNSTALAVQALRLSAGDHSAQIAKALTFLAGAQNGDGGFDIDSANDFSDVRATAQVVGGIVGRSYATLLHDLGASAHAVTGAAYLVGRLTDGTHLESSFDDGQGGTVTFVDYGLTADLALALASANSQDATLAKVVGYLRAHVGDYVDQTGAAGGPYSGAAGKLAVLAESTGQDPSAFGGVDLLALLTGNVCTTGNPDPNAFDACTAAGDFRGAYSGVSQALAVLALGRAGVAVPAAALTRLGQLQCADGGFSSVLIAPGAAVHLGGRHDRVCGSGPQPAAQRPGFGRPRLGVPAHRTERRRRLVGCGGGQLELDGSRDPGGARPPRPRRVRRDEGGRRSHVREGGRPGGRRRWLDPGRLRQRGAGRVRVPRRSAASRRWLRRVADRSR